MVRKLAIVLSLSISLVGCAHTPHWHSASTIPLAAGGFEVLGPVKGQDCLWLLFGIIPLSNSNETHVAIENAIKAKRGADALINVTADSFRHSYIIVSKACVEVDGTAVRSQ